MMIVYRTCKKLSLFVPLTLNHCRFGSTNKWPNLKEICRTGNVPKKFNFANHVFDKHVEERPAALGLWIEDGKSHEQKLTFSDLQRQSIIAASAIKKVLSSSFDSNSRPFVFTILPNVAEWWYLYLGCIRMGAVFCPGTTMLSSDDIQFRLEASQAQVVITNEANMIKVDEAQKRSRSLKSLKKVVVSNGQFAAKDWHRYNDLISDAKDSDINSFQNVDTNSDDLAQVFFTSGTTGRPKMVAHTHASYGIGHYRTASILGLKHDDINWCISDPGWAKASYSNFFAPWIAGCTVYIHQMERFEAEKVLNVLHTKPITTFCAPPTLYRSLVQVKDKNLFKFKNVRYCVGAGEPVTHELSAEWKDKTGIRLYEVYGQTEMVAMGTVNGSPAPPEGSWGRVDKDNGFDLRILDDKGVEVPRGTEGTIGICTKPVWPVGLFKGYMVGTPSGLKFDIEKHASCFIGDFYLTGDRAIMDKDGFIFYVGRSDDIINSAGYRIGPFEVESVLQSHPAVVEAAAVASPDPNRGEVVKAFVVLAQSYHNHNKDDLIKELQDYMKKQTAPYKYPRKIEFVTSLPKTVSGKILRRELKKLEYSHR